MVTRRRTRRDRLRAATRTLWLSGAVLVLGSMMFVNAGAGAQYMCPRAADPEVLAGWADYRAGDMAAARRHFEEAAGRCPRHAGARTGLGYVELRDGDTGAARDLFDAVLRREPDLIDALVGRGIVAWRDGDLEAMEHRFRRVLALEPGNAEAVRYLALIHPAGGADPAPPDRPPLVLPDTVEYVARAAGDRFEVRGADGGWTPFYVRGINLGAALPGRYASQFPDSMVYAGWLDGMRATGANAVRVYTRHPPAFYEALADHNARWPGAPLWLIHGVWAELPPEDRRYDDPAWQAEFLDDVRIVVDIVHGRADVPVRPGMAGGHYTADVSRWTLAYVLGREWESASVIGFNALRPDLDAWRGRYVRVEGVSAMEAWLAMVVDSTVAHETAAYRAQRPVSYTAWPTTDPLHHPTETTSHEEARIRVGLGEDLDLERVVMEGEDAVTIDPARVEATDAFPAGFFATYHVYPYYPDFMNLDPGYQAAVSPWGPSSYWGYLTALKAHHAGLPVLIGEYGLPSSIGLSHVNAQGWHHGGITEERAAAGMGRMTREIAAAGLAGGVAFEWIDEWFKRTWLTYQFESPRDRDRMWYNRMDSEEHYGLIALEPEPRVPGATLAERLEAWDTVPALYGAGSGAGPDDAGELRAVADEAYLRVLYRPGAAARPGRVARALGRAADPEILIGFDVVDPDRGDFRWPDAVGAPLPVGLEVVLRLRGDSAVLLHDTHVQPYRVSELPARDVPFDSGPAVTAPPPGFFVGRYAAAGPIRVHSRPNHDGFYEPARVIFSRRVFGRDSTEYGAMGYDAGLLPRGPEPDGLWETEGDAYEIRIPWAMLNVADPSRRMVLEDTTRDWRQGALDVVRTDGIRVVAAARRGGGSPSAAGAWAVLPASGRRDDVALFTWAGWDEPRWRARARPVADTLRAVWRDLDPAAAHPTPRTAGP